MMRCPATPGEFDALMAFLEPVDPERRPAIARMVFLEVATCPRCERSVRRCDARRLVDDRLLHLTCASDADDPSAGGSEGEEVTDRGSGLSYEPGCTCESYLPLTDIYGNERCARCDRTRGVG